jgi:hypothetical protein
MEPFLKMVPEPGRIAVRHLKVVSILVRFGNRIFVSSVIVETGKNPQARRRKVSGVTAKVFQAAGLKRRIIVFPLWDERIRGCCR